MSRIVDYTLNGKLIESLHDNGYIFDSINDKDNKYRVLTDSNSIWENLIKLSIYYFETARTILVELEKELKEFDGNHNSADDMCMPLLFAYRHSLELLLKGLVAQQDDRNGTNLLKEAVEDDKHKLENLYRKINKPIDDKFVSYFSSVDASDFGSSYFRYPRIVNGDSKYTVLDYRLMSFVSEYVYSKLYSYCEEGEIKYILDDKEANDIFDKYHNNYLIKGEYNPGYAVIYESPNVSTGSIKDFYPSYSGYIKAARLLFYSVIEGGEERLMIPVTYFFRHSLELLIKYYNCIISPRYKEQLEKEMNININNKVYGDHKLNKECFENIITMISKWAKDNSWETKTISKIINIVNEVSAIDNNDDYFRYPINLNCELRKYDYWFIPFVSCIDYVIGTIENCSYMLEDINDSFLI